MLSGNFKGSEIQHGIFLPRGRGGGGGGRVVVNFWSTNFLGFVETPGDVFGF